MSLFARLSFLFAAILVGMGSVVWLLAHHAQQRYFEETTQQLNRPVAMYIAEQVPLFINGSFDRHALVDLASHVMIVNPSLELYLLDTQGHVVAAASDENQQEVLNRAVDLDPIFRFLDDDYSTVFGDDPKVPGQKRIFSAYPVNDAGIGASGCTPCGYVYAVLGREQFSSVWQAFKGSQTSRYATVILLCVLVCALLAGVAVFFMLTMPLRSMTQAMQQWQLVAREPAHETPRSLVSTQRYGNELQVLESTCRQMAKRLTRQYEELASADLRRRHLFTRLSHDLRTPLTSVCGVLETLLTSRTDMSNDERYKYLTVANRQAHRLHHLIDQVFELARLDSGDVGLHLEPLSFRELTMDTVQELMPHAADKGISLRFEPLNPEHEPMIEGDMAQLNRVLVNLLSNAIRCTPEQGTVKVTTRSCERQGVVVTVADSGCGFSRVLKDAPLSTLDCAGNMDNQAAYSGTGLGLGIVSRILALHGSEATVTSRPGQGALVRFSLNAVAF